MSNDIMIEFEKKISKLKEDIKIEEKALMDLENEFSKELSKEKKQNLEYRIGIHKQNKALYEKFLLLLNEYISNKITTFNFSTDIKNLFDSVFSQLDEKEKETLRKKVNDCLKAIETENIDHDKELFDEIIDMIRSKKYFSDFNPIVTEIREKKYQNMQSSFFCMKEKTTEVSYANDEYGYLIKTAGEMIKQGFLKKQGIGLFTTKDNKKINDIISNYEKIKESYEKKQLLEKLNVNISLLKNELSGFDSSFASVIDYLDKIEKENSKKIEKENNFIKKFNLEILKFKIDEYDKLKETERRKEVFKNLRRAWHNASDPEKRREIESQMHQVGLSDDVKEDLCREVDMDIYNEQQRQKALAQALKEKEERKLELSRQTYEALREEAIERLKWKNPNGEPFIEKNGDVYSSQGYEEMIENEMKRIQEERKSAREERKENEPEIVEKKSELERAKTEEHFRQTAFEYLSQITPSTTDITEEMIQDAIKSSVEASSLSPEERYLRMLKSKNNIGPDATVADLSTQQRMDARAYYGDQSYKFVSEVKKVKRTIYEEYLRYVAGKPKEEVIRFFDFSQRYYDGLFHEKEAEEIESGARKL